MNLPVWDLGDGAYLIDDLDVDSPQSGAMATMSDMDIPPLPGDGGDPGDTNSEPAQPYVSPWTTNNLWIEIQVTDAIASLTIHPAVSDGASPLFDLLMTTNLSATVPGLNLTNWMWLRRTTSGETNLVITNLTSDQAYFLIARTNDADGDGLSDAREHFVYHTDPSTPNGPFILTQPSNQTVQSGDNVSFSVSVDGAQLLRYQWRLQGTDIVDATNSTFALPSVLPADEGTYAVVISNSFGSVTSSNANLIVADPPVIIYQLTNVIAGAGQTVLFTIATSGTTPLTYQWKKDGTNVTDGDGASLQQDWGNSPHQVATTVSGSSTPELMLQNVGYAEQGSYTIVVSNSFGCATTNVTLTVIDPFIDSNDQPRFQTVNAGQNTAFQVSATGTPPISYQWQKNGTNLSTGNFYGAATTTLGLTNISVANAGDYTVLLSSSVSTLTSSVASLTVRTFSLAGNQYVTGTNSQTVSNFAVPYVGARTGYVVSITNSAGAFFLNSPAISTNGNLTYRAATTATGTAYLQVALRNSSGATSGPLQTFSIKANIGRAAKDWYVAPSTNQNVGNGTTNSPWDLQTALIDSPVQPGDTIWLRGGKYHYWHTNGGINDPVSGVFTNATLEFMAMPTAFNCKLEGTANAPITIRAYSTTKTNERPIIDGFITQWEGGYVTYRDLETTLLYDTNRCTSVGGPFPFNWQILEGNNITDFNQSGFSIGNAAYPPIYGIKLINCIIHDNLQGLGLARTYYGKYIYGCIMYYNGWHSDDDRNHGHGFYLEHEGPDQDYAMDNLSFHNFAQGAQNYGSTYTYADRGTWDGNVFWMNGHMAGDDQANFSVGTGEGTTPTEGTQIIHNMTYTDENGCGSDFDMGYTGGMQNGVIQSNYLGSCCQLIGPFTSMQISSNTFAGGTINIDSNSWPKNNYIVTEFDPPQGANSGSKTFIRTNLYEKGRANIIIYNWGKLPLVAIDISSVGLTNGAQYELHQVNDYFNDVKTGTYYSTNKIISISMTNHTIAAPVGQYAPINTFPNFGAFVIQQKKILIRIYETFAFRVSRRLYCINKSGSRPV